MAVVAVATVPKRGFSYTSPRLWELVVVVRTESALVFHRSFRGVVGTSNKKGRREASDDTSWYGPAVPRFVVVVGLPLEEPPAGLLRRRQYHLVNWFI